MREKVEKQEKTGFHVGAVLFFCLMLLAMLAMISHRVQDIDILSGGVAAAPGNWIGHLGAWFSWHLLLFFGLGGYVLVTLFLLRAIRQLISGAGSFRNFLVGTLLALAGSLLLLGLTPEPFAAITENLGLGRRGEPLLALSGGVIGQFFSAPAAGELPGGVLREFIGAVGTMVAGWALVTAGGVMIYVGDWHRLLSRYVFGPGSSAADAAGDTLSSWMAARRKRAEEEEFEEDSDDEEPRRKFQPELPEEDDREEYGEAEEEVPPLSRSRLRDLFRAADEGELDGEEISDGRETLEPDPELAELEADMEEDPALGDERAAEEERRISPRQEAAELRSAPAVETVTPKPALKNPDVGTRVVEAGEKLRGSIGEFVLPPITMLAKGTNVVGENREAIEHGQAMLQNTLDSFQVAGHVTGFVSGPRVTRFEITMDPGVPVKKVEQIAADIAANLQATSVRVLAPIPGRSVVGVEVSNSRAEAVFMRSVMESEKWQQSKAEIPIALGKDVAGEPVILDLAKAPHMLVAGATGTGKSVCTNTLIMSLLFTFRPDQLRLIMVDPKIVEFDAYRTLPHLLTPIINEAGKVPIALRWAANEMDRRYHVLARAGVKKLSEYNSRKDPPDDLFDDDGNPLPPTMPLLVIIIDELADLMMTEAKKDVETNITRIAQKGRAAGIHIIVATQRPSTNIITGVIKANLPTRLCFQVRSLVDSRVVLDTGGADKLLGKGDLLFMSSSSMTIERVQGAFVPDDDIKSVVKFVSDQAPQHFNDNVLAEAEEGEEEIDEEYDAIDAEDRADIAPLIKKYLRPDDDETMKRALEVVILDRKASTSYLQRRLKIGYNRAAELIDSMEERGIVGPPSGSGNKRDILVFDGMEIGE